MIALLVKCLTSAEMANNQGLVLKLTIYFPDIFKIITSAFLNSISLHYKNLNKDTLLKVFRKIFVSSILYIHEVNYQNIVKEQTEGRNSS